VQRAARERPQDEHRQRALDQILFRLSHSSSPP
jgi:hypothetical protein